MIRSPVSEEQVPAVLGPMEAHGDWRNQLWFPLRGNVIAAYYLDDERNHAHVQFCDIQLHDGYPMVHRVAVGRPGFRQETREPGPAGHRWRNAYPPNEYNGTNGWAQTVLPGDLVIVQFVGGRWTEPYISGFWAPSNQGRENDDHPHGGGYPFNQQSRFRMTGGEIAEEIVKRLDAVVDDAPQWTWAFNGAFVEILNDGSLLLQSSTTQAPIIPEDRPKVGLKKSPEPQGDFIVSTRGARRGDLVMTTGKSEGSGKTNAGGNVLVLGYQATQGNVIVNIASNEEGNFIVQSGVRKASQIFLRAKDPSDYVHVADNRSEVSHHAEVALRSVLVSLGRSRATKSAVTWEELTAVMGQLCMMFDMHVHPGVDRGNDETDPPSTLQSPYFEGAKTQFQSAVVKLELNHQDDAAQEPAVEIKRGLEYDNPAPSKPKRPRRGAPSPYGAYLPAGPGSLGGGRR